MNSNAYNLHDMGFNIFFEKQICQFLVEAGLSAGRILKENHNIFTVLTEHGEFRAEPDGKINARIRNYEIEKPVVGDWVLIKRIDNSSAVIQAIFERFSVLYRNAAGKRTEKQLLAANIDYIFIVCGLDYDINLRRIERYLTIAWESGAQPVIILNKSDLIDTEQKMGIVSAVKAISSDTEVILLSALNRSGIEMLNAYLQPGKTSALIGSSGCGKSTLINAFLGSQIQAVKEVRESDSRGRHTTTGRELFILQDGGIVIDNPGLREIQLYSESDSLEWAFSDIEEFAKKCRFRNCRHNTEPGCAVQKALLDGDLDSDRFAGYLKLLGEIDYLENRKNSRKSINEKKIARYQKELKRYGKQGRDWG